MPLFEVAIIERATEEGKKNGLVDRLILKPTAVVAVDEKGAIVQVGASIKTLEFEASRAEVLVRPFSK